MNLSAAARSRSSLRTWHENLLLFDRTYELSNVKFNHLMGKAETGGEVIDYLRLCFAIRKVFQDDRGGGVKSKYLSIIEIEDGCSIFRKCGANRIWDFVHVDGT